MDINHLRYFLSIIEHGSMSATAKKLRHKADMDQGLYERVVSSYGTRDALILFFGAFGLITFVLARGELRRRLALGKSGFRSPFAFMTAKAFEGAARFCAFIALTLGLFAMAQY